jgi:hypothetical protein
VNVEVARRAVLGSFLALTASCSRSEPRLTSSSPGSQTGDEGAPAERGQPTDRSFVAEKELDFPNTPIGAEKALALVPTWGGAGERFPVLIALHGRGEAVRGVAAGARGWWHDYDLGRAIARLRSPPLTRGDFQGFVSEDRLARINASLAQRPFRGLVVVCPWVPDLLSEKDRTNLDAALPFGTFAVEQLLPRVMAETPAQTEPPAIGIDGVSLGGRVALLVGLEHADRFSALGTLQAAILESEAPALARRARQALAGRGARHLRLLTSDQDYFRGAIAELHAALNAEQVAHEYLVVAGPHDYAFNRGPGGIEMLLWHDRVLREESPL